MAGARLILLASALLLLCVTTAAATHNTSNHDAGGSWSSQEDTVPHASPGPGPTPPDHQYDYGDLEYEYDLDLDSEEDFSSEEVNEEEEDMEGEVEGEDLSQLQETEINRVKRKVIFGGGGGYGGVSRRGGGGGDPYGRRRGGHNYHGPGPDYTQGGGWPYPGSHGDYVDTSSFDQSSSSSVQATNYDHTVQPTSSTTPRPRTYGIVRKSPSDTGNRRGGNSRSNNNRQGGGHQRDTKEKLSKALKEEIAQYALDHSTQEAVHHYSAKVGRRLSRKKVEKFVSRYQARLGRTSGKN
ncbi:hypothetical protein Pmani_011203 [Petrolisthes manimaculis]|uniref:Uncharacterized protein n=1 Tax=Petrolisthes manimaculis TaxID=1843537 RepID=A0AAE1Q024_9EUCA|nr:hypothetical protein Pmani_011203 [Petrolisthes manimaculis]